AGGRRRGTGGGRRRRGGAGLRGGPADGSAAVAAHAGQENLVSRMTLDRREAVAALLENRGELLVVSGLGSPTYDVHAAGDSDANFYLWGAMGGAALVGLGLAQARPDRTIVAITGDGEQLMGLGGLAPIAVDRPQNPPIAPAHHGRLRPTRM